MNQFTQILVDILATALATALICLIKAGVAYIGSKCKSEKLQLALQEFQTVLQDGIGYVEQTYVRIMKENNAWDKTTQKEALGLCKDYILNNLTNKTTELLTEDKEDIQNWIEAKIESYIQYEKHI